MLKKSNLQLSKAKIYHPALAERIKEGSVKAFYESFQPVSVLDILNADIPSIRQINDVVGSKQISGLLLWKFKEYLSLGDFELTVKQIALLIERIVFRYDSLSVSDIELMLKMGISGELGEIYGKVRIDTVLGKKGWLETYVKYQYVRKREIIDEAIREFFIKKGLDPDQQLNAAIKKGREEKKISHIAVRLRLYKLIMDENK